MGDTGEDGWDVVPLGGDLGTLTPFATVQVLPQCAGVFDEFRGVVSGEKPTGRGRVNLRRSRADDYRFLVTPDVDAQIVVFADSVAAGATYDALAGLLDGDDLESCWNTSVADAPVGSSSPDRASLKRCEATGAAPNGGVATGFCLTVTNDQGDTPVSYEARAWRHGNAVVLVTIGGDPDGVTVPTANVVKAIEERLTGLER